MGNREISLLFFQNFVVKGKNKIGWLERNLEVEELGVDLVRVDWLLFKFKGNMVTFITVGDLIMNEERNETSQRIWSSVGQTGLRWGEETSHFWMRGK